MGELLRFPTPEPPPEPEPPCQPRGIVAYFERLPPDGQVLFTGALCFFIPTGVLLILTIVLLIFGVI